MYDLMKSLAAQLLMPLPVGLGLMVVNIALNCSPQAFLTLFGLGLAIIVLSSWGPVAERMLSPLESHHGVLKTLPKETPVDAIVVLGGGWRPEPPWSSVSRLSDSSAIRLMEGIRLWRQALALPLILSGGSRTPGIAPVAQGYAAVATEFGVPDAQMHVIDWPADTVQEALAVRDKLGERARVALVTSASHMPRAMSRFRQVGLNPVAAPTHYLLDASLRKSLGYWVPSARHLRKSERAIYEVLGLLIVAVEH